MRQSTRASARRSEARRTRGWEGGTTAAAEFRRTKGLAAAARPARRGRRQISPPEGDGWHEVLNRQGSEETSRGRPAAPPRRQRRIPNARRDKCLNCLSTTHRIASCRRALRCLNCHGSNHMAGDCKRPRSPGARQWGRRHQQHRAGAVRKNQAQRGQRRDANRVAGWRIHPGQQHTERQAKHAQLRMTVTCCRRDTQRSALGNGCASFNGTAPSTPLSQACVLPSLPTWRTQHGISLSPMSRAPCAASAGSRRGHSPSRRSTQRTSSSSATMPQPESVS